MGLLDGIRAISMGSAWAGPYVGRVLSEMGAEVFRIDVPGRRKSMGVVDVQALFINRLVEKGMTRENAEKAAKTNPSYTASFWCNDYGIGLDLGKDKGKNIYQNLIRVTDIVIDGFSPRVMANLGLDYPAVSKIKPDIIYLNLPGMGMTGPEKDVRMWGTGCEWLGGLTSIRGYNGEAPHRACGYIVDGIDSPHLISSLLGALIFRDETGQGQHIDCSMAECATYTMGQAIMDYSMNERVAGPTGNRHPAYAPHNCYRCQGDDKWVTIAITSQNEWQCFCDAINHPEWKDDSRFADEVSRWQNQEALDKLIEEWTQQHNNYAIQEILQSKGIAATAVTTLEELILYDPQMKDRNFYQWLTYHDGIADPVFRIPWVYDKSPTSLKWCGPFLGQHNDYLLKDVLGMSDDEIAKLYEEEVVGIAPPVGI